MERDSSLRCCWLHSPEAKERQRIFKERYIVTIEKKFKRAKKNSYFLPLLCVFRPYQIIEEDNRVIFVREMCLAKASRRIRGNKDLPRYPNRFGEPLCKEHAHYAQDEKAFPGKVSNSKIWVNEELEEQDKEINNLINMMRRSNLTEQPEGLVITGG